MGLISKVVLVCITLVGLLLGNMGFRGNSPEGIAVGILGVLIALIALTFLLKFLWRFLGCLSTILIALVLVIILLILTGTFDKVTDMIKGLFTTNAASEQNVSFPTDNQASSEPMEYISIVNEDGTTGLVPIPSQKKQTPLQQAKTRGTFEGSVTAIRSGNQFVMDDLEVILYGIDAPDPQQVCSDKRGRPYNCGQEAIRQFRRFTGNSLLSCKVKARSQRDNVMYAVCNIDNNDVGVAMVSSGWAFALPNVTNVYEPYESVANASRAGMWSGQFYKPAEWRAREAAAQKATKKSSSFFGGLF